MYVMDMEGKLISGEIILDGVRHPIAETGKAVYLEAGRHTIEGVPPSEWSFDHWQGSYAAVVDDVNANPTGITITGAGGIYLYLDRIAVGTALSISLTQTPPVEPGSSLTFTGQLTRPDTGEGLPGQATILEQPPGAGIAIGATDANGNYSITVTAPIEPNNYQYRTSFAETAGLSASASKVMGVGVGVPSALPILALLGIAYAILK